MVLILELHTGSQLDCAVGVPIVWVDGHIANHWNQWRSEGTWINLQNDVAIHQPHLSGDVDEAARKTAPLTGSTVVNCR